MSSQPTGSSSGSTDVWDRIEENAIADRGADRVRAHVERSIRTLPPQLSADPGRVQRVADLLYSSEEYLDSYDVLMEEVGEIVIASLESGTSSDLRGFDDHLVRYYDRGLSLPTGVWSTQLGDRILTRIYQGSPYEYLNTLDKLSRRANTISNHDAAQRIQGVIGKRVEGEYDFWIDPATGWKHLAAGVAEHRQTYFTATSATIRIARISHPDQVQELCERVVTDTIPEYEQNKWEVEDNFWCDTDGIQILDDLYRVNRPLYTRMMANLIRATGIHNVPEYTFLKAALIQNVEKDYEEWASDEGLDGLSELYRSDRLAGIESFRALNAVLGQAVHPRLTVVRERVVQCVGSEALFWISQPGRFLMTRLLFEDRPAYDMVMESLITFYDRDNKARADNLRVQRSIDTAEGPTARAGNAQELSAEGTGEELRGRIVSRIQKITGPKSQNQWYDFPGATGDATFDYALWGPLGFLEQVGQTGRIADPSSLSGFGVYLDTLREEYRERFPTQRERGALRFVAERGLTLVPDFNLLFDEPIIVEEDQVANRMVLAALLEILEFSHRELAREDAEVSLDVAQTTIRPDRRQERSMQTYVELLKELKEKGFVPKTWDTTERMQGLWRTFTSFTSRGANVKIRITPQGIIVYNPLQTLGEIQEIEIEEERNGEFKKRKKQIRQYGGGPDLSEIRWAQLLGDTIVEVDLVPFMDWIVGALSRFEAIGLAKGKLRESLTARGPGSVVIRIEGREEPLLELPPMPYPRAVAAILQKIASVMVDAGPQTGMDLVKFLTSNE